MSGKSHSSLKFIYHSASLLSKTTGHRLVECCCGSCTTWFLSMLRIFQMEAVDEQVKPATSHRLDGKF